MTNKIYDEIFEEVNKRVNFNSFEEIDLNTLVKVQLGSGLIVLNNMLRAQRSVP
jgi:hypothetical protein